MNCYARPLLPMAPTLDEPKLQGLSVITVTQRP